MEISVSVIVHNEAEKLKGLLDNLKGFASEIVVVDCESDDGAEGLLKNYPVRYFKRPNDFNLNRNKQFGIEQCTKDWIIYIDPDERISDVLKQEIREKTACPDYSSFEMPRRNHILGKPLRFGGHYPDRQLRLFRKGTAHFPCVHVHEKLKVKGLAGLLKEPMDHYPYPTVGDFLKKLAFYSEFQAKYLLEENARITFISLVVKPCFRFTRRLILKGGILDGIPGIISIFFDFAHQ